MWETVLAPSVTFVDITDHDFYWVIEVWTHWNEIDLPSPESPSTNDLIEMTDVRPTRATGFYYREGVSLFEPVFTSLPLFHRLLFLSFLPQCITPFRLYEIVELSPCVVLCFHIESS